MRTCEVGHSRGWRVEGFVGGDTGLCLPGQGGQDLKSALVSGCKTGPGASHSLSPLMTAVVASFCLPVQAPPHLSWPHPHYSIPTVLH